MKAMKALPENYKKILVIDLKKNKKLSFLVNFIAIVIAVVMIIPAHFIVPISVLFDMEQGLGNYALRFGVLAVSAVVYIILHELVHGIAMKICGTQKVKYGFTGLYAFAGSEDYYDKRSYIFIALAPVVLWGVLLAVLTVVVPDEWFWIAYSIQITNISGAAGDFYVTAKFSKLSPDILIKDYGLGMTVYSRG